MFIVAAAPENPPENPSPQKIPPRKSLAPLGASCYKDAPKGDFSYEEFLKT